MLRVEQKKVQLKINVTFRSSDFETELYNFVIEQGGKEVGGVAGYIKRLLADDMKTREGK